MTISLRFCSKCDYQAEDCYDMDGHKWFEQDDEDHESLRCNSCNMTFSSLRDLMYHKKDSHGCSWKEFVDPKSDPFSCKLCNERFKTLRISMLHNKTEHKEKLAECWKFSTRECNFGDDCWLKQKK